MIEIRQILYPTDFSDYADHARAYVTEMAKAFKSKVVLMHTIQAPSHYEVAYNYELAINVDEIGERRQKAAEEKLEEVAEKIRAEGVEVEAVITLGSAFVDIVSTARKREIDLIILSTHGWGFIKHVLMGSTAERVVRKAPCPVLTVRKEEHEFIHP
jgi:nucleotide-binding universal stress UspA family protein